MTEELVQIEVDGQIIQARKGSMLIEATDAVGIDVPRFCYHKHLSVVANCRMCLVDVENAPKPLPACATPVADGMKVRTASARALDAQRGTMEFLLINHPLDCPICDQGGECELQDLSLGYGEGISRFTEGKRAVVDEDLGPLIATDMTRCIHCTRCVRFGEEIAGVRELGATGRGEDMRIGTYVGRTVTSEMSGNVIDLCPVGALTNKPARYTMRPWELIQQPTVSPHDAIGTNLFLHTRLGRVMRAVPRENPEVNETWIADRDRYSHFGMYSEERVRTPLVRRDGIWEEVDWEVALDTAAKGLRDVIARHGADAFAGLVSPCVTTEEQYLVQRLVRGLGSPHVDHRLRQLDFSDQSRAPVMPWLGQEISDLEALDAALLIGSNVRKEQPLAAHRLRKAALRGARIGLINARRFDFHFDVETQVVTRPERMASALAGVIAAASRHLDVAVPDDVRAIVAEQIPDDAQRLLAATLCDGELATVLLGEQAIGHPQFAVLRRLAAVLAEMTGARPGYLPEAGNTCGAWLSGCVPHRAAGGTPVARVGDTATELLSTPRPAYLLYGIEPEFDSADPVAAVEAIRAAEFTVAVAGFRSEALLQHADVILPAAMFAETDGTFVNAAGLWQPFRAAAECIDEVRPGWKILRVLANQLGVEGMDYHRIEDVRSELHEHCREITLDNRVAEGDPVATPGELPALVRFGSVPMYSGDPLVRHSAPLQQAADAGRAELRIGPADARTLELEGAERVRVSQDGRDQVLPLVIDDGIPSGMAWIPLGLTETAVLGPAYGTIELQGM